MSLGESVLHPCILFYRYGYSLFMMSLMDKSLNEKTKSMLSEMANVCGHSCSFADIFKTILIVPVLETCVVLSVCPITIPPNIFGQIYHLEITVYVPALVLFDFF
uniref:Uncharacterized protein n=1 Tax=Micrurus spixii TaxID=129469 RepID=A0A2D4M323_9SAUR